MCENLVAPINFSLPKQIDFALGHSKPLILVISRPISWMIYTLVCTLSLYTLILHFSDFIPCEIIEFDTCKSVLPYADTGFPNFFGQTSHAEVGNTFDIQWNAIISLCPDMQIFICNLAFPKCNENSLVRYELLIKTFKS